MRLEESLDKTILNHACTAAVELEDVLKSDVVYYFGQIGPGFLRHFRDFVEAVKQKSERTENTLSIVLRTLGGSAETTEQYVSIIRHHYDEVNFIIPDMAYSAGTILCMSGDKIFMDYTSSLGPIDPQVMTSDGSGYVSAMGYLDKVEEMADKSELSQPDVVLLSQLDLGKLALYEQAQNLSIDLLKKWLVKYKFKSWKKHRTTNPGKPVTEEEKTARAEEIAKALSDNKFWHSHGRSLDINKLKALRLEICDYSNNEEFRSKIRTYNDSLSSYCERMGFPVFFHSHLLTEL